MKAALKDELSKFKMPLSKKRDALQKLIDSDEVRGWLTSKDDNIVFIDLLKLKPVIPVPGWCLVGPLQVESMGTLISEGEAVAKDYPKNKPV